jgi:hypothetical protein
MAAGQRRQRRTPSSSHSRMIWPPGLVRAALLLLSATGDADPPSSTSFRSGRLAGEPIGIIVISDRFWFG